MKVHHDLFAKGAIVRQKGNMKLWEILEATDPDDLPKRVKTLKEALPHVRYTVKNVETGVIVKGERHYLLEPC